MRIFIPMIIFFLTGATALAGPEAVKPPVQDAAPLMTAPIRLFQKYLSGADGHRCPMTPSCSSYAAEAIRRYGALKGWIMASDRLMRCGRDELKRSPSILTPNGIRCQDPVERNAIWPR